MLCCLAINKEAYNPSKDFRFQLFNVKKFNEYDSSKTEDNLNVRVYIKTKRERTKKKKIKKKNKF